LILGATMPMWPRGAWSIVVEAHFYILLPIVLALARRRPWAVLVFLAIALALRGATWLTAGNVQMLAYKTIVGRIDQFVLGVVVFYLRPSITNRVAAGAALAFFAFYAAFDAVGGYTRTEHSPVWIFLPSIEGAAYAVLISWYDARPGLIGGWGAALLQRAGEYSYSIYLLHFFFFAPAAKFVDTNIMSISQLYLALPWSLAFFGAMMCVGHLVYHCFEKPFLKMRLRYTRDAPGTTMVQEDAQSAPARFVTAHSPDFDPADAREIAR
jgi:peptidoglycan/LPS O-acetylase OafA/YrhL